MNLVASAAMHAKTGTTRSRLFARQILVDPDGDEMILIVDYGMGNVGSVKNAVTVLGFDAVISRATEDIKKASHIILPGVGAFKEGMENLETFGLVEILADAVLKDKKPFLGICLGMEMLAEYGEEAGSHRGLGWIKGRAKRLNVGQTGRLPHVGWNDVILESDSTLFRGIKRPIFYFLHSYHLVAEDRSIVTAYSEYGERFVAAVQKGNILGVQFHPEKSQRNGLKVLENFLDL